MRPGAERNMMVEVNYRQGREGMVLDTVVQDVYLCASMEFLLTVADLFLKASQQGFAPAPQSKPAGGAGDKRNAAASKESAGQSAAPTLSFASFVFSHCFSHLQIKPTIAIWVTSQRVFFFCPVFT